jgi:hypothetical protein
VIVALGVLLGIVVAVVSLVPRVTITSSGAPMDPENPYLVTFTTTNNSPMLETLNDVSVGIVLGKILTEPLPFKPDKTLPNLDIQLTRPEWNRHKLLVDETYTVTLDNMFALGKVPPYKPIRLSGTDIGIVVKYKPWILPWHHRKIQRFITEKHSDGKLYWTPIPLE